MNKPNIHLLGMAHTKTNKDYMACAYTQKVLKMGKMLTDLGYKVYHYGAEGSELSCAEHITCVTDAEQAYTYEDTDFSSHTIFEFNRNDFAYVRFNARAIKEINARKQRNDILLCSMGNIQKEITDKVGLKLAVEMGIGYTGVFSNFRVFESYAWMHYLYGMLYPNPTACDGKFYDAVIPNYYDPDDFCLGYKKQEYILYLGRLTTRKGVSIAYEVAKKLNRKLKVAGVGSLKEAGIPADKNVEFLGYVDNKTRAELMANARAILVPTLYLEPFGGVNVEAMFCGTPAITTDWGGFTETVQHGKTGYRCRTIEQFCWAVENTEELLPPEKIREYAINNYSLDRVGLMYKEYFDQLQGLFGKGFYEENPLRLELNWLKRY